jgi:hypothetical protein
MYHFATTLVAGIIAAGDRCLQGGGEGHEVQVALAGAPEIRRKLHDKVG